MSTKKILLPVDVAHIHPECAGLLNELIPLSGAAVHLLFVREELPALENMLRTVGQAPDEFHNQVVAHAQKVMGELAEKIERYGAKVTKEITAGPAAMMIEKVAKDEGFELTVLPPGSKQSVDKYLLGRVSGKVVRHAPGTVLLLRGDTDAKMQRIVIGLDGSDESLSALRGANEQFGLAERNIPVTLLNVVSVLPIYKMISPISYISQVEGNLRMSGETVLAEGDKILSELGVKNIEMKQVEGDPAKALMEAAHNQNASLIVVGAQGKNLVEHFLLGSTSGRLADNAKCAVAVFKGTNGKA